MGLWLARNNMRGTREVSLERVIKKLTLYRVFDKAMIMSFVNEPQCIFKNQVLE